MNLVLAEEVLSHLHNWFVRDSRTFTNVTIEDEALPDEVASYVRGVIFYRIQGSMMNDGLYLMEEAFDDEYAAFQSQANGEAPTHIGNRLHDEVVDRLVVSRLVIPRALVLMFDEIADWEDKYGEVAKGPFFSEMFGGYKYEIRGYSSYGAASSSQSGWRLAFANRLNPWRKMYG